MKIIRDCILLIGVTSTGKTTVLQELKKYAQHKKIPHNEHTLSDAEAIVKAMEEDDACGGYHHTHDWCTHTYGGHDHRNNKPKFPFIVTDNVIPERMIKLLFQSLNEAPFTGKLYFVEWAGGMNTCSKSHPLSQVDFSYTKIYRMMKKGIIPNRWLYRIKGIIHLVANDSVRILLNENTLPLANEASAARQGWKRSKITLSFFGRDDYDVSGLKTFFDRQNIPAERIKNDASSHFFTYIGKAAEMLL